MRTIVTLQLAALLSIAMDSAAATIGYQHPDLTIVAREEPLASVLQAVGREMRIYVTMPTGLDSVVNCDIQQQPVKQAFKTLLGDTSYSLEWEKTTGQLLGVTILAGGDESAVTTVSDVASPPASVNQAIQRFVASGGRQQTGSPRAEHNTAGAEQKAREAAMEQQRQEEEIAREARLQEALERHDAEAAAYVNSQGMLTPQ